MWYRAMHNPPMYKLIVQNRKLGVAPIVHKLHLKLSLSLQKYHVYYRHLPTIEVHHISYGRGKEFLTSFTFIGSRSCYHSAVGCQFDNWCITTQFFKCTKLENMVDQHISIERSRRNLTKEPD